MFNLLILLIVMFLYKPFRHYILSFFFSWLYRHPTISKLVGIDFKVDTEWSTNRQDTQLYMSGIFIKLFTIFTGMNVVLTDKTRKSLMDLQALYAKNLNMGQYFNEENMLKLKNLEDFDIFDRETLELVDSYIELLRSLLKCLMGSPIKGIKLFIQHRDQFIMLSKILKLIPEEKRLLVFVPQLTLVSNFTHMLIKCCNVPLNVGTYEVNCIADLSKIEPHSFLELTSEYFVLTHKGNLTFVTRHKDTSNYPTNLAFGPKGCQCPGNIFTFKFIASILQQLQRCQIHLNGNVEIEGSRFLSLKNPRNVGINVKIDYDT
jgi:hypothetical protein